AANGKQDDWSYYDQERWPEEWPECGGRQQSPVNIDTRLAAYYNYYALGSPKSSPVQFTSYDLPLEGFTIRNNGHTIAFSYGKSLQPSEPRPAITGSLLKWNAFVLSGFHFHWGQRTGVGGSEHTFNGLPYDMEVHLVHYNADEYRSFDEAIADHNGGGVTVLSLLFKVSPYANRQLEQITELVARYSERFTNQTVSIREPLYLDDLLPAELTQKTPSSFSKVNLFAYRGSLTTPPCTEGVTWLVADVVNTIGYEQIEVWRRLRDTRGRLLGDNFRELQPLNRRLVTAFRV
ncbi:Ca14p, partial [Tyrophagus putrescentiae]